MPPAGLLLCAEKMQASPHALPRRHSPNPNIGWHLAPRPGVHQEGKPRYHRPHTPVSRSPSLASSSRTEALCNNLLDACSSTPDPDVAAWTRVQATINDEAAWHTGGPAHNQRCRSNRRTHAGHSDDPGHTETASTSNIVPRGQGPGSWGAPPHSIATPISFERHFTPFLSQDTQCTLRGQVLDHVLRRRREPQTTRWPAPSTKPPRNPAQKENARLSQPRPATDGLPRRASLTALCRRVGASWRSLDPGSPGFSCHLPAALAQPPETLVFGLPPRSGRRTRQSRSVPAKVSLCKMTPEKAARGRLRDVGSEEGGRVVGWVMGGGGGWWDRGSRKVFQHMFSNHPNGGETCSAATTPPYSSLPFIVRNHLRSSNLRCVSETHPIRVFLQSYAAQTCESVSGFLQHEEAHTCNHRHSDHVGLKLKTHSRSPQFGLCFVLTRCTPSPQF